MSVREIRAAMHQGTKATLHAAATFPKRHPFLISGVCIALLFIFLGAGIVDVKEQVKVINQQTRTLTSEASVCNKRSLHSARLSSECAERLRLALMNCRLQERCRQAWLKVKVPPPAHREGVSAEGGGSQSPGVSHPGQQPGGGRPSKSPASSKPKRKPKAPTPSPEPTPAPTTAAPTPPAPALLNPGGPASAQGHGLGLEVCLTLPDIPPCVKGAISGK